jgi:hypothetical protein
MSARSSAKESNSLAARASSSSASGSTFSFTCLTSTSTVVSVPSASVYRTFRLSPTRAPTSADSISPSSRPAPSSITVSGWPSPSAPARSTTSVSPSRASRSSAGTSSATEFRSASSSCWTSSSGTTDSARGTSSVVQSTIWGVGCTSTVALKLHGSLSEVGSAKSYSGVATGRRRERAAAFQNQPPMCDSTASAHRRSLPTFASSTWRGTLPLRKPGIRTEPARSDAACSTACSSS